MSDQITACPDCDSPAINKRQPTKPVSTGDSEAAWLCGECGSYFDEPRRRDRRDTSGRCGLAGALAAADSLAEVSDD